MEVSSRDGEIMQWQKRMRERSSIVFPSQQQSVMSPPTQSAATTVQLPPPPSATSAAKPAGVVVLSQPITKAEVRGLFGLWNDALHTLDPATVAKRYAKEGVLLPTLSDVPRNDVEGIKDYFVHFLEKKPDGKILEGEIFIGNNWAQDAGELCWYIFSCHYACSICIIMQDVYFAAHVQVFTSLRLKMAPR